MRRWLCAFNAFSAFLMAASAAQAEGPPVQVAEAPARVLRTGLDLPDRLATTYAWLDADHLAVTTPPKGDEDTYSGLRRVVLVDSRTGAQKTLLERGYLTCANPHTGVVAAYVGDLRKLLRGGDAPEPVLTWFRWDRQRDQLVEQPLAKGQAIHREQCRAYEPEQDLNGQVSTGAALVRYLEPGHGQIRWRYDHETQKRVDVRWERAGQRRALEVPAEQIAPFVEWMPYRAAYLLSPGLYYDIEGQHQGMLPMTTMDLQGRVSRQPTPPDVKQALKRLGTNQAFIAPMRDGLLVIVNGRSESGGGFYRHSRHGLQRLFCGAPPGTSPDGERGLSQYCFEDAPISISPDGCKAAFVSRYDFDGSFPTMGRQGQIHVLELCARPAR